MLYKEVYMDLFDTDNSYALAHCISKNCRMGAGIAVEFVNRFHGMKQELISSNPEIGYAMPYLCGDSDRLVFNLITKDKHYHKPTYESFTKTIENLKSQAIDLDVYKIAMPTMGAGLDRLNWNRNREIIKDVFKDTDIEILVCRQ